MFVEVHMIQSFPAANLNRDDANNPKDCEFGGVRRARISSQCLKRAIRTSPVFEQYAGAGGGIRTKLLIGRLVEELVGRGKTADQARPMASALVQEYASKLDSGAKRGDLTAVALYVGRDEVDRLAGALAESWPSLTDEKSRDAAIKKIARDAIAANRDRTLAPDLALFGRMLAEHPVLNLDAACQVAHAFSTHRVSMDMDFYTAVDDLQGPEQTGGAMMGFIGFNSACFYRYARLDWDQLVKNLGDNVALAKITSEAFLRAAEAAIPRAKQNSFAAHSRPSFLLSVTRKDGVGWSLANAFERPVTTSGAVGLVAPSIERLDRYWGSLCRVYGTAHFHSVSALSLEENPPLNSLKAALVDNLETWVRNTIAPLAG